MLRKIRKYWPILIIAIVLAILTYIGDPTKGPILPCVFNKLTGLYCPGCGMTRALHHAIHLNFKEASRFNLLIFVFPPLYIIYELLNKKKTKFYANFILILMFITVIGYGILRNLESFSYLKPGGF